MPNIDCFTLTLHTLWRRHNGCDSISNHQPHDCLLNRLFRSRSKKTSKLSATGFCAGNSPHKWPVTRTMFPFDDIIMNIDSFTSPCTVVTADICYMQRTVSGLWKMLKIQLVMWPHKHTAAYRKSTAAETSPKSYLEQSFTQAIEGHFLYPTDISTKTLAGTV